MIEKTIIERDLDSGEVTERTFITKKKVSDHEANKYKIPFGEAMLNYKGKFQFIKTFTGAQPEFSNNAFRGYFYSLAPLLHYNTCALAKIEKGTGVFIPYSGNQIIKYLKMGKNNFYKFRKEAIELGAIARVQVNNSEIYLINPAYMTNGSTIDYLTYVVFCNNEDFMRAVSQETREYVEQKREYYELKGQVSIINE